MRSTHALLPAAIGLVVATAVSTAGPRFYDDDPIAREPESRSAAGAAPLRIDLVFEYAFNLFVTARRQPSNTRAGNINTIDEVPDSSWFTNRIGKDADHARAPGARRQLRHRPRTRKVALAPREVRGHQSGLHRQRRQRRDLVPAVRFARASGGQQRRRRDFDEAVLGARLQPGRDLHHALRSSHRQHRSEGDGQAAIRRRERRSRTTTSIACSSGRRATRTAPTGRRPAAWFPGTVLGPFRYAGTRSDDPNDLVSHEHRRELRALRVFGAWTNLVDLKAGNTLDSLVEENGRTVVKHYLQDVGSTFGMANNPHEWDMGWEHFYEPSPSRRRLMTFGFALSPWQTVPYTEYPSVGLFEGDHFDPTAWKPQTPVTRLHGAAR